ncbi:hypothetical protein EX30DRAFT_344308 [Ascodesmis nigricans]|uniref:Uncharacterized protein n=1 Tax=Ascodesmis nigricans TaxID=341454 RepID=A0A4S2MJR0_9PEZI|nr:hypothetical protein EX30DRAFT_344308 [Ascodesmis nigricans]
MCVSALYHLSLCFSLLLLFFISLLEVLCWRTYYTILYYTIRRNTCTKLVDTGLTWNLDLCMLLLVLLGC